MRLLASLVTMGAALGLVAGLPFIGASSPKLLICSDSTSADFTILNRLQGWAHYVDNYLTIDVSNLAKSGRSTRSFINEGLWDSLLDSTVEGDLVLIEMGHNDKGNPRTDENGRATLPGTGDETVVVTFPSGERETVHTFGWYLRQMIGDVLDKGAVPIISGMTPLNSWDDDDTIRSDWPFADYAQQVATETGAEWVDHTRYSVAMWQSLGEDETEDYFPKDDTHTNRSGAEINAETFIQAVKYHCGRESALNAYLNDKGQEVVDPPAQSC